MYDDVNEGQECAYCGDEVSSNDDGICDDCYEEYERYETARHIPLTLTAINYD